LGVLSAALFRMNVDKTVTTTGVNEDPLPLNPDSPRVKTEDEEDEDKQDGVRVAEAVTSSWSRQSLIIVYAS
jgi:hypothetical protein